MCVRTGFLRKEPVRMQGIVSFLSRKITYLPVQTSMGCFVKLTAFGELRGITRHLRQSVPHRPASRKRSGPNTNDIADRGR